MDERMMCACVGQNKRWKMWYRQKNLTYLGLTVSWRSNRIFDRPINGWEISSSVFGQTRCTRLYVRENFRICLGKFSVFPREIFGLSRGNFHICRGKSSDLSGEVFRFVRGSFQICPGKFSDLSGEIFRFVNKIFQIYHNFLGFADNFFFICRRNFFGFVDNFFGFLNNIF